jgi:hypothetical protein
MVSPLISGAAVTDAELQNLVTEFSKPRPEFQGKSYVTRRRDWFDKPMESIRPLLLKDRLQKLSEHEALKIYKEMSVGGPKLYPKTFAENGVAKIRASLAYLLYGSEPLEQRFHNFAGNPESEYRLSGVGRAFASTALFLLDHNEYPIWNAAVDGGLKALGLLPDLPMTQNLGVRYVATVKAMKSLKERCGFEDLSLADEFVELIYHGKLGSTKPPMPPVEPVTEPPAPAGEQGEETEQHLHMQYCLVRIGLMRGHDVWVAANDQNKTYQGTPLSSLALAELPHFAGPEVLSIAKMIDVIWFKKGTASPVCFFEVEHSTSVYSGLLRLNDVRIDYPVPKAFIVAAPNRRTLFDKQIGRRTFVSSELSEVCQFLSYDDVNKLMQSSEVIKTLLF